MPGTTPTYDLPYPEGHDLVIQGDDAIQALAEAVEGELSEIRTRSHISTDTGPAQTFSSAGGVLEFSTGTISPDWAHDGVGTYTFSGPNTWFLLSLRVNLGPNTTGIRSTVVLTIAGAPVQTSDFAAAAAGGTDYARHSPLHRVPAATPGAAGDPSPGVHVWRRGPRLLAQPPPGVPAVTHATRPGSLTAGAAPRCPAQ